MAVTCDSEMAIRVGIMFSTERNRKKAEQSPARATRCHFRRLLLLNNLLLRIMRSSFRKK